ncbi:hypothetical protein [Shimia sp. MIT1388]|uniref:hypothetical protein n=1 Tax=Shimia sp. MIT1388 TaxID=3096992 RepID=UPI00399B55A0
MQASGVSSDTGDQMVLELSDEQTEEVFKLASLEFTSSELKQKIDNLDVSADVKALLYKFTTKAVRVGEKVIKIGQKILETIIRVISEYPNTTFGFIFGAIAGTLVGSVPLVGWVLGPLVTPIFMALGLVLGAKQDFLDKALESRVKASVEPFFAFNGANQDG